MIRLGTIITAAILAALPALAAAAVDQPEAAKPIISGALALSGSVKANSQSTPIPDLLLATTTLGTAKTITHSAPSENYSHRLAFGTELVVTSGKIVDKAGYGIPGAAELTSSASSTIAALSAEVKAPTGGAAVLITAKAITSAAAFSKLKGDKPKSAAAVKLTNLTVDLTGLGYGKYTYNGSPKPNTVLFKSSTGSVIVYLNKQTDNLVAPKDRPAVVTLKSVNVDAVSVVITNVSGSGFTVSGTMNVASSFASDD